MASCPACGTATETGDRFCSACGDALAEPGLAGQRFAGWVSVGSPDEPELLVLEPAPTGSAPEPLAPPGRPSPKVWLVVAGGVLAATVALWGMGRGDSGPGGSADAARPAPTTATSILRNGTTATTGFPDTTATAAMEAVPTYDRATGGPVLGRPVGWSLMVGDTYNSGLERIDLDSGVSTHYPQAWGAPVAVSDGRLLLQAPGDEGGMHLRAVPLNDPAAEGAELVADGYISSSVWPVLPGRDGGVWIYASTARSTTWRLVRPSDGELIDEVPAPLAFRVSPLPGGGPDVATSPSGGLYRRDGGGYRLLHPARPILINRGAALVVGCSLPDACVTQWVDLERGEPVQRRLPPDDGDVSWIATADEAGRFLVGWRAGDTPSGRYVLYDTDRQRLAEVGATVTTGEVAATPDGRYLAVETERDIQIFDADEDRWVALPRTGAAFGANLVFVPNSAEPR